MKRMTWIDFLKTIAITLVIVLHTITIGVSNNNYESGVFIYYFGTFAIPIFFMVNGYLQLSRQRDYKYAMKKIIRILLIVLIWNLLYFILETIITKKNDNFFELFYNSLIQKGYFSQFWFLGSLIIIYLVLPVLQRVFRNTNSNKYKILTYSLISISIVADIINIMLYRNCNICMKEFTIQTFNIWIWMTYFCLGGFIYNTNIFDKMKKSIHCIIVLFMICLCLIYECLLANSLYGNMFAENFYNSPIIMITGIILFTFIKKLNFKREKLITTLGSLTMGVYIIHSTVIMGICKFYKFSNNYESILLFIGTLFITYFITWFISKIKYVREIIRL